MFVMVLDHGSRSFMLIYKTDFSIRFTICPMLFVCTIVSFDGLILFIWPKWYQRHKINILVLLYPQKLTF